VGGKDLGVKGEKGMTQLVERGLKMGNGKFSCNPSTRGERKKITQKFTISCRRERRLSHNFEKRAKGSVQSRQGDNLCKKRMRVRKMGERAERTRQLNIRLALMKRAT